MKWRITLFVSLSSHAPSRALVQGQFRFWSQDVSATQRESCEAHPRSSGENRLLGIQKKGGVDQVVAEHCRTIFTGKVRQTKDEGRERASVTTKIYLISNLLLSKDGKHPPYIIYAIFAIVTAHGQKSFLISNASRFNATRPPRRRKASKTFNLSCGTVCLLCTT